MAEPFIEIQVNSRPMRVPANSTVFALRHANKPDADLVIHNGFPVTQDYQLAQGDEVILIRHGEIPGPDELEALLVARHGPGVHAQLKQSHVGIAGCGGLGSTLAVALARTGVGSLTLVDFDTVEPSNLNRQQFYVDQIGQSKTAALAANLCRINPYVRLECHQLKLTSCEVPRVFGRCNVVAECFDNPSAKAELSTAMRRYLPEVPLVGVSGIAGFGPASAIRSRRIFSNHFLIGDGVSAAAPGRGLLAPRVTIAAGSQANLIVRLLLQAISPNESE